MNPNVHSSLPAARAAQDLIGRDLLPAARAGAAPLAVPLAVTSAVIPVGSGPRALAATVNGKVYVVDSYGNAVSVINSSNDQVIGAPIPVGSAPVGIAAAANGRVYVANSGAGTVTAINSTTDTVIGSPIPVGSGPVGAAAANGRIYVANFNDNTVSVIDSTTDTVIGPPIPVGVHPSGVAAAPNGRVFVANSGAGTVTAIDSTTNTVIGSPIPVGTGPVDVAAAPNGRVYVTNHTSNTLSVIDSTTDTVIGPPIPMGGTPWGVAASPGGHVYVTNVGSRTMSVIDSTTNQVIGWPVPLGIEPYGIAAAPNGNVYVANRAQNTVTAFDQPVLTGVTPTQGSTLGGTRVTIAGTGLNLVTGVTFGGVPATDVLVNSSGTQVIATAPPGAAGPVTVAVTGMMAPASLPNAFTYATGAPLIITPTQGPTAGGTQITITGANLQGATVTVGGRAATNVYSNPAGTQITATTPAGTTGPATVTVTTAAGTATSLTGGFTYVPPAPVISSVTPAQGPATGGQTITLTGTDLAGATGVTVGGSSATILSNTATQITARTPSGTAGPATVTVTTAGGTSNTAAYTYVAAPTLTSVSPAQGPTTGENEVVVTGANLAGATVTIGGRAATNLYYNAAGTQIIAIAPSGTAGPATVTVTTPGGSSSRTDYAYVAVPTLTSVHPPEGPAAGGAQITLTGTNLAGATGVTVGGAPATILSNTATQITARTPSGTAGPATVTVTTAGGTSNTAAYTYVAAPVVTSLSPAQGPLGAGTRVTLTGTNLAGAGSVTFNGAPATILSNTGTQITVTAPGGTAGPATVTVTTPGGTSNPTTYAYLPAPTLSSVTPNRGTTAGGTQITLTGTNLAGATVTVDGRAATNVYSNAAGTQIIATTPPGSAGSTNVTVTTPAGSAELAGGFTYLPPAPVITSIAPVQGPAAGGQTVTLAGADLTGVTAVTFNGSPATILSGTGTQIVVRTPSGTAGPATVLVTSAGGTSNPAEYTYLPAPTLTSVSPHSGTTAGGSQITLTGTNLAGATVTIGGRAATNLYYNAAGTQIVATTPSGTAGAATVTVTTGGGSGSLAGGFTYVPPPAAAS